MGKQCEICGKKAQVGNLVSHSNIKTKRRFTPTCRPCAISSTTVKCVPSPYAPAACVTAPCASPSFAQNRANNPGWPCAGRRNFRAGLQAPPFFIFTIPLCLHAVFPVRAARCSAPDGARCEPSSRFPDAPEASRNTGASSTDVSTARMENRPAAGQRVCILPRAFWPGGNSRWMPGASHG